MDLLEVLFDRYGSQSLPAFRDRKSSGSIASQIVSLNTSYEKSMGSTDGRKSQSKGGC